MKRGISYDIEPDRDARNYIDFEHLPYNGDEAENVCHLYHVGAFWTILSDLGATDILAKLELLEESLRTNGADQAYKTLEWYVNNLGYDTYNSDTRFEVFERPKRRYPATYDEWAEYTSFWANCVRCGELHVLDDLGIVDAGPICDTCFEE